MTEAEAAAYLSGMIDGEGCISFRNSQRRIRITNTDLALLEYCSECFVILGIETRIYAKPRAVHKPQWKEPWELSITGRSNLERCAEVLTMLGPVKAARLAEAVDGYQEVRQRPSRDVLVAAYSRSDIRTAAADLGVSATTFRSWLRAEGIERRTNWETRAHTGRCSECGCRYDERTPHCSRCKSRHWQRDHCGRTVGRAA